MSGHADRPQQATEPPIANPPIPALAISQTSAGDSLARELATMQAAFPQFRIWREDAFDRARFVARSLRTGLSPHTVVTDDLSELRAALQASQDNGRLPQYGPATARETP
jgi:hypothetical protein